MIRYSHVKCLGQNLSLAQGAPENLCQKGPKALGKYCTGLKKLRIGLRFADAYQFLGFWLAPHFLDDFG